MLHLHSFPFNTGTVVNDFLESEHVWLIIIQGIDRIEMIHVSIIFTFFNV